METLLVLNYRKMRVYKEIVLGGTLDHVYLMPLSLTTCAKHRLRLKGKFKKPAPKGLDALFLRYWVIATSDGRKLLEN